MTAARRLAVAVAVTLGLLLPVAPASAEDPLHPDVQFALDTLPGGHATSTNSAEWPELGITFEVPLGRSVSTCATGSICAYQNGTATGTKTTFASCGTFSTIPFGAVGSIANARSSGYADAKNSSGTLLKRVFYGTWSTVPAGVTQIKCTTGITL